MNRLPTTRKFLGSGWPFPIVPASPTNELPYVEGVDKVRQSIWTILQTEPGERIMRPTFGCGLRAYLMKPNTSATRALIQRDVERALASWEPRIKVDAVSVEPGEDPAEVAIYIRYQHVRDGSADNLVFRFALE